MTKFLDVGFNLIPVKILSYFDFGTQLFLRSNFHEAKYRLLITNRKMLEHSNLLREDNAV